MRILPALFNEIVVEEETLKTEPMVQHLIQESRMEYITGDEDKTIPPEKHHDVINTKVKETENYLASQGFKIQEEEEYEPNCRDSCWYKIAIHPIYGKIKYYKREDRITYSMGLFDVDEYRDSYYYYYSPSVIQKCIEIGKNYIWTAPPNPGWTLARQMGNDFKYHLTRKLIEFKPMCFFTSNGEQHNCGYLIEETMKRIESSCIIIIIEMEKCLYKIYEKEIINRHAQLIEKPIIKNNDSIAFLYNIYIQESTNKPLEFKWFIYYCMLTIQEDYCNSFGEEATKNIRYWKEQIGENQILEKINKWINSEIRERFKTTYSEEIEYEKLDKIMDEIEENRKNHEAFYRRKYAEKTIEEQDEYIKKASKKHIQKKFKSLDEYYQVVDKKNKLEEKIHKNKSITIARNILIKLRNRLFDNVRIKYFEKERYNAISEIRYDAIEYINKFHENMMTFISKDARGKDPLKLESAIEQLTIKKVEFLYKDYLFNKCVSAVNDWINMEKNEFQNWIFTVNRSANYIKQSTNNNDKKILEIYKEKALEILKEAFIPEDVVKNHENELIKFYMKFASLVKSNKYNEEALSQYKSDRYIEQLKEDEKRKFFKAVEITADKIEDAIVRSYAS